MKNVADNWSFPHKPRSEQEVVMHQLSDALNADASIIHVEAPVGVGKSPIAIAFGRTERAVILVPQNMLQEQYLRDWPLLINVKGQANYTCHEGGTCKKKFHCTQCPYTAAKARLLASQHGMTNYALYLAMARYGLLESEVPRHPWIVADEGHNLDEAIISTSEVSFTSSDYARHVHEEMPEGERGRLETSLIVDILTEMQNGLRNSIEGAPETSMELLNWEHLEDSIRLALESLGKTPDDWVGGIDVPMCGPRRFWLKPLSPAPFVKSYLGDTNILTLSATPHHPDLWCRLMGVDAAKRSNMKSIRVASPFPVENRRIHYRPIARVSRSTMSSAIPKLAEALEKILPQFTGMKGIIHTSSFKLASDVYELLSTASKQRILLHNGGSKVDALRAFSADKSQAILMSPSIMEGLDLKDGDGRFNIILKVPYPSLGDPWINLRRERLAGWYEWKTAIAMAQASGRTTRHHDDWSTTIILDGCFGDFFNRNPQVFPAWFSEAVDG